MCSAQLRFHGRHGSQSVIAVENRRCETRYRNTQSNKQRRWTDIGDDEDQDDQPLGWDEERAFLSAMGEVLAQEGYKL